MAAVAAHPQVAPQARTALVLVGWGGAHGLLSPLYEAKVDIGIGVGVDLTDGGANGSASTPEDVGLATK